MHSMMRTVGYSGSSVGTEIPCGLKHLIFMKVHDLTQHKTLLNIAHIVDKYTTYMI